jgi:hypothetical protein
MGNTDKIIAEMKAQIQKYIVLNKASLEKIIVINNAAIEKIKANNRDMLAQTRTNIGIGDHNADPVTVEILETIDLFPIQARVDEAVIQNQIALSDILIEIQHISDMSLENAKTQFNKAAETRHDLIYKTLLDVQGLAENGIQVSQTLLELALSGSRSNVGLSSMAHKRLSSKLAVKGLRPSSLQKSEISKPSDQIGSTAMEKIEYQISEIETARIKKLASIMDELKEKLADVQYELTQKGTTYQNELSGKLEQAINHLYQDSFNQINNLGTRLRQVKTIKPQVAVDLTTTTQNQILKLLSQAIKDLSSVSQASNHYHEISINILIQRSELYKNTVISMAGQTIIEAEQKLHELKSKV